MPNYVRDINNRLTAVMFSFADFGFVNFDTNSFATDLPFVFVELIKSYETNFTGIEEPLSYCCRRGSGDDRGFRLGFAPGSFRRLLSVVRISVFILLLLFLLLSLWF